jgi:hypothetical protein
MRFILKRVEKVKKIYFQHPVEKYFPTIHQHEQPVSAMRRSTKEYICEIEN